MKILESITPMKTLLVKGLPKLAEQGIMFVGMALIIWALWGTYGSSQRELIDYLKDDRQSMIEALERNTQAFENCIGISNAQKKE